MARVARWFALLALTVSVAAQDDLRDRIVRIDGGELRGRIVEPFAADELLLMQGGKRVRVPHSAVASIDSVALRRI